jgi:hypothetical protein
MMIHIVVKPKGALEVENLIPISSISGSTPKDATLDISSSDLRPWDTFENIHYLSVSEPLGDGYDIPMVLAQDFTVVNIAPEQIVTRQPDINLLLWTPPPPPDVARGTMGARSEAKIPQWLVDSVILPID